MIRHAILASLLATAGCIDQGQSSDVGTTDQDLTVTTSVCGTCYSSVVPIPWSARAFSSVWDYWAPPPVSTTALPPNLQMVAFVVNGEPVTLDVNGAVIAPATRMVWLISNRGVYRVYEVAISDVADMTSIVRNSFTIVENAYAGAGYASPGSTIIVGVDGGAVNPKGGGTPHGFPFAVVNGMVGYAATIRPIIVNVQDLAAGTM
jgi:hypothetical protein